MNVGCKLFTMQIFWCISLVWGQYGIAQTMPRYLVSLDEKWGYADSNGMVIDFKYDAASDFYGQFARVSLAGKTALINKQGLLVTPFEYIHAYTTDSLWIGLLEGDSLTIMLSNLKEIYRGPGTDVWRFPSLDRIAVMYQPGIHSNNNNKKTLAQAFLLKGDGTFLRSFSAPYKIYLHQLTDRSSTPQPASEKQKLVVRSFSYEAITDIDGNTLLDSVNITTIAGSYKPIVLKKGDSWAVINFELNILIPFSAGLSNISPIYGDEWFQAKKNGKWGVIDVHGNEIIPFILPGVIEQLGNKYLSVKQPKNKTFIYHYFNYRGEKILSSAELIDLAKADTIPVPVRHDNMMRLWKDGSFIGETHKYISEIGTGNIAVYKDEDGCGLLNAEGRTILKTKYAHISYPANDILCTGNYIKTTEYKNDSLNVVSKIPTKIHVLSKTGFKPAVMKYFYTDLSGNKIFDDMYDAITPFRNGRAMVMQSKETYLVDEHGKRIGNFTYISIEKEGLWVVRKNKNTCDTASLKHDHTSNTPAQSSEFALADSNGKIISPWVSAFEMFFNSGYSSGIFEWRVPTTSVKDFPDFPIPGFRNGLIIFQQDGKWGIMDTSGSIIAPAIYENVYAWNGCGYIIEKKEDLSTKTGLLNSYGKIIAEPIYYKILPARLAEDHQLHFISIKNKNDEPQVINIPPGE